MYNINVMNLFLFIIILICILYTSSYFLKHSNQKHKKKRYTAKFEIGTSKGFNLSVFLIILFIVIILFNPLILIGILMMFPESYLRLLFSTKFWFWVTSISIILIPVLILIKKYKK